jgi:hypothetical protein
MKQLKRFMKPLKKYWWVILVVAVLIYILILNIKMNKLSDDKQLQAVELSTLKDSVLNVVTRNGQLLSKIQSVEVEKGNLKEALDIAGFDIKELRKDNIKKNDIILAMKAQLEATGTIYTTIHDTFRIVGIDTVYYSTVNDWTDNKLYLYGGTIEKKNLNFKSYNFRLGFDFFVTEEKNKSIVTVKFPDQSVRLTSANSITVVHKKKIWERGGLLGAVGIVIGLLIPK